MHQIKIFLKVLPLKTRGVSAIVVLRKIFKALELPGQEAASQRTISNETNAQFAASAEQLFLWFAAPQRGFGLQRSDGMNRLGPTKRLRGGLRKPELAT